MKLLLRYTFGDDVVHFKEPRLDFKSHTPDQQPLNYTIHVGPDFVHPVDALAETICDKVPPDVFAPLASHLCALDDQLTIYEHHETITSSQRLVLDTTMTSGIHAFVPSTTTTTTTTPAATLMPHNPRIDTCTRAAARHLHNIKRTRYRHKLVRRALPALESLSPEVALSIIIK